jgi:hypothetical protein
LRDRAAGARGLGLKPEHYRTILDTLPDIGFFEIHAENYMGAGGPPHRFLEGAPPIRCRCMASACRSAARRNSPRRISHA